MPTLNVDSNLSTTEQYIEDASGNASNLAIGTGGAVGIGTTGPSSILHIKDSGDTALTVETSTANANSRLDLKNTSRKWRLTSDSSPNVFSIEEDDLVDIFARLTIEVGGNVGIGTTNPGALLDVRGSVIINEDGGDKDVRIEGDTDANLLFSDASTDRVGIGTSVPLSKLHIKSTSSDKDIVTLESTAGNIQIFVGATGGTPPSTPLFPKGSLFIDITNADLYIQTATTTMNNWSKFTRS